jgi:hypothetical protein
MLAVARFKRLAKKDGSGSLGDFKEKRIRLTEVFKEKGARNEMRKMWERDLSTF